MRQNRPCVRETGVRGARVDVLGDPQLLDAPHALKVRVVDDGLADQRQLDRPVHLAMSGWQVSSAFGVRYGGSTRAFYIELPYFSGTVQSRQRP